MLEEFGLSADNDPEMTEEWRQAHYRDWTEQMRTGGGAGALVWMLGKDSAETPGFATNTPCTIPNRGKF